MQLCKVIKENSMHSKQKPYDAESTPNINMWFIGFCNLPVSVKQKRCPANALQKGFNLKWLEGLWNKRI